MDIEPQSFIGLFSEVGNILSEDPKAKIRAKVTKEMETVLKGK